MLGDAFLLSLKLLVFIGGNERIEESIIKALDGSKKQQKLSLSLSLSEIYQSLAQNGPAQRFQYDTSQIHRKRKIEAERKRLKL